MTTDVNPFSTGGGGVTFEIQVQASFLALLLIKGRIPCFPSAQIDTLHLQAGHLGFHTDDVVAEATDATGKQRKLAVQIKHTISISVSNQAFTDALRKAWADFSNASLFNPNADALALITGPQSANVISHFRPLLEWSRASANAQDFLHRINTPQYTAEATRQYWQVICQVLRDALQEEPTDEQIWQLLRSYHLLSYDFDRHPSQDANRVKDLLALAAHDRAITRGEKIWHALLELILHGNPNAATFVYDSIPGAMRADIQPLTYIFAHDPVHRLQEHGREILGIIQDAIASHIHIPRTDCEQRLSMFIDQHRFVLVTGTAGIGKSALAKDTLQQLSQEIPVLAFRAEEFAYGHIDEALSQIGIHESLQDLSVRFPLHPRKLLFIDSLERLLEAESFDAFLMFLQRVKDDPTWRVVMTCRSYALEQVRDIFFLSLAVPVVTFDTPALTDDELQTAAQCIPGLVTLLSNPRVKTLLRNPFFLKQACQVDWSTEPDIHALDEQTLRGRVWRDTVQRQQFRTEGMPLRRETCFFNICLARARLMQPFVSRPHEDLEALQALIDDELVITQQHGIAPAHDLLEDWALIRWVDKAFFDTQQEPVRFFSALGHEPAIRRSFRLWLKETFESSHVPGISPFVTRVVLEGKVEPYWRDETLTGTLLSGKAAEYIAAQRNQLLANNKALLRRLIHLLRTACKSPNEWLLNQQIAHDPSSALSSLFLRPAGNAWPAVLQLVREHLDLFGVEDLGTVLGLLEDWASSVSVYNPTPSGARDAGLVALHYWNLVEEVYGSTEIEERLLKVMLAVPHATAPEFRQLVEESFREEDSSRRRYSGRQQTLYERMLSSFDSRAVCEYMPELVIAVAREAWGLKEATHGSSDYSWSDISTFFGLSHHVDHEYFPPSRLQGPFFFLFKYHPQSALSFIVELSNHCAASFSTSHLDRDSDDSPYEVVLTLNSGETVSQWGNLRLWCLYRALSVGPDILQSALMALEDWLLEKAKSGAPLASEATQLLQQSNNVAVTAVVASVAIAYPQAMGEAVLPLLRTREFFLWDRARMAQESGRIGDIRPLMGLPTQALDDIYYNERKESDQREHRRRDLEHLVANLQLSSLGNKICEILDAHLEALPPIDEQSEEDKVWRLALHRMDLRHYSPQEDKEHNRMLFMPKALDQDLQEYVESHEPSQKAFEERVTLLYWGMATFKGEQTDSQTNRDWREMLSLAKSVYAEQATDSVGLADLTANGGPIYVAAVCIRDHWQELNADEQQWCTEVVATAILTDRNQTDHTFQVSRFEMHGSRPAAVVLPLLLDAGDEHHKQRIRYLIACALTHASEEVRRFAVNGVRRYLWERDEPFAKACIKGLFDLAKQREQLIEDLRRTRSYGNLHEFDPLLSEQIEQVRAQNEFDQRLMEQIEQVRTHMAACDSLSSEELLAINFFDPSVQSALPNILVILYDQSQDNTARTLYRTVAEQWELKWERERENASHRHSRKERNFHLEHELSRLLSGFVMNLSPSQAERVCKPVLDAGSHFPEQVAQFLLDLTLAEDQTRKDDTYWALWQAIADNTLKGENFSAQMQATHSATQTLIQNLFLMRVPWKEGVKEWAPLTEQRERIRVLVSAVGQYPAAFEAICRLLHSVGGVFLPEAFLWVDQCLQNGEPGKMLVDKNTVFCLENILRRAIYGTPAQLRETNELRSAVIRILDKLVDQGSSVAFRMREYFISPSAPRIIR